MTSGAEMASLFTRKTRVSTGEGFPLGQSAAPLDGSDGVDRSGAVTRAAPELGEARSPDFGDWLGLKEQRVLIAGTGGIGAACAAAFRNAGAELALIDISKARLDAVAEAIGLEANSRRTVCADLGTLDPCRSAVSLVEEILGGIDVVIHSVGTNVRLPILDLTEAQWNEILKVNLFSAYALGQATGRLMCSQGHGRIIFFSSVSGHLAHPHHGAYASSKGGLNQLMRVMAVEWAARGVTVNAIAPGYMETALTEEHLETGNNREELTAKIPMGRLGVVDDVVGAALFLSSDHARFITGQVLYVDGGRTLL